MRPAQSDPPSRLPRELVESITEKLRSLEPRLAAVIATGSYVTDTAAPDSDFDVTAIYAQAPAVGYHTWFEVCGDRLLPVSVEATTMEEWRRRAANPADWSLGFPTDEPGHLLMGTDDVRKLLGDSPHIRRPAAPPELEDFLESAIKAKRATGRGDGLRARWHAHFMAALAPRLLIPLNPKRRVTNRDDALRAALTMTAVPEHYSADLVICLGLDPVSFSDFSTSALRLPRELLAFLRERRPDVDRQPWLSRSLADGTLERWLNT